MTPNLFNNARAFIYSSYICIHQNVYHSSNLSLPLLKFLDHNDTIHSQVYIRAMSEYLKLMPESTDFDEDVEDRYNEIIYRTNAEITRGAVEE